MKCFVGYGANIELKINDENDQIHQRPKPLWKVI